MKMGHMLLGTFCQRHFSKNILTLKEVNKKAEIEIAVENQKRFS